MRGKSGFADFWPEYVQAHSRPGTRAIHLAGTLAEWLILVFAIAFRHWWWIAAALAVSYGLAWISHFFVEHNRPASFEHPLWSWWADQKMGGPVTHREVAGANGPEKKGVPPPLAVLLSRPFSQPRPHFPPPNF